MRPRPVLSYGEFFGSFEARREVAGFSLSLREPDPEREVERHTHEEAHFILLLRGHYVSSARDAGDLPDGPALLYNPPGTTHRDRFHDRRGRFFAVSVSAARTAQAAQIAPLHPAAIRLRRGEAMALAQRLARECRRWERASPLAAEGLCLELLAQVAGGGGGREGEAAPGWLARARELLHDRCADELSVADVAAAAGVHPIHLARAFRRFFGVAPGEYLRRCRLERAAALLRDGARPLAEIALGCGFADQSHFAKAFKRAYLVTPGEYRRQARG